MPTSEQADSQETQASPWGLSLASTTPHGGECGSPGLHQQAQPPTRFRSPHLIVESLWRHLQSVCSPQPALPSAQSTPAVSWNDILMCCGTWWRRSCQKSQKTLQQIIHDNQDSVKYAIHSGLDTTNCLSSASAPHLDCTTVVSNDVQQSLMDLPFDDTPLQRRSRFSPGVL